MGQTQRRFKFSWRVTLICGGLALLMLRASLWQWDRHNEKLAIIAALETHLALPIVPIDQVYEEAQSKPEELIHRRVKVSGEYDFENEVILRNRRLEDKFAGVHVLTPLKLEGSDHHVLVDRGFVPLASSTPELRKQYQKNKKASFVGLIKENHPPKFFQPSDQPTNPGDKRIDAWLRPDVIGIQKQLPYPIPAIYLEIMEVSDSKDAQGKIVEAEHDGRDDLLLMANRGNIESFGMEAPNLDYPIPQFTTIVPPGRHLGYVYEWAFMAIITVCIGLILQRKKN